MNTDTAILRTASEARLLSANREAPIEEELEMINFEIILAARLGLHYCFVPMMSQEAVQILDTVGYSVTEMKDPQCGRTRDWVVFWDLQEDEE